MNTHDLGLGISAQPRTIILIGPIVKTGGHYQI